MKNLKLQLPVILMILFELIIGILLLVNPEAFTVMILSLFGGVLLVVCIVYLIRWLRDRKDPEKASASTIVFAVITLILGLICLIGEAAVDFLAVCSAKKKAA